MGRPHLLLALSCMCSLGCQSPGALLDAALSDGTTLQSVGETADTAIVLLDDPAECFVCESPIRGWQEWVAVGNGRKAFLILTREPTRTERHHLIVGRLDVSRWLTSARVEGPDVRAFINGIQVDSAYGRRAINRLYHRWLGETRRGLDRGIGTDSPPSWTCRKDALMYRLLSTRITLVALLVIPAGRVLPVEAQGCSEVYCLKIRQSTGACDIPAVIGCNCACNPE